jgi:hypothetical protein
VKTKIVEVGGQKYQVRMLTPAAGSFIYFKMLGCAFENSNVGEATAAEAQRAKESAAKLSAEEKARALVISTFMRGLSYEYIEFAQKQALTVTSRVIETGGAEAIIPIMHDNGRWVPAAPGEVDLQEDPSAVQQITVEALVLSLACFFAEGLKTR